MAGEVITTGTRAADAARADAQPGTNPSTQDAEQAEAAVAADVPEPRVLNGTPDPKTAPPPARGTGTGTTRAQRARVAAAQNQPADAAVPGVGVRRRLARLGAQRGDQPGPRAADQDRARDAPEGRHAAHRARLRLGRPLAPGPEAAQRRSVHHPPARGGDDPGRARHEHRDDLRRAAARHGGGHPLHADRAAQRFRRGHRDARRRRHQAGQGQVRRVRRGGDRPQDGGRDVPRHPGPGDQARRPAAQHADAALPGPGEAGAQVQGNPGDLRAARPPPRHEHGEVGARGPRLRDPVPQAVRRDRPPGVQPGAAARGFPAGSNPGRQRRPARGQDQPEGHRPSQALLLDLPEDDRQGRRLRRHLRPGGHPRPGRFGQGLLRGARHHPRAVEPRPRTVQGLHRDAEVQHVPVAAHDGHRPRRQVGGAADPHLGHAPPGGVRRRGALEVQGRDGLRPGQGRQGRNTPRR